MYVSAPQISGMGSFDLSGLSSEDYLLIGIGGAILYELFAGGKPRRRRRKSSGVSWGTVAVLAALGAAGYYVWTSGTQLGAQLAQGSAG